MNRKTRGGHKPQFGCKGRDMSTEHGDLLQHLESNLGVIAEGWSNVEDPANPSFQIVRFENQPMKGASTFTTLGLSGVILTQSNDTLIREELIFCCNNKFIDWGISELLATVGDELLSTEQAFMRGQVLGPAGPLFNNSSLEALYCARPVYFPEALHEYTSTNPITSLLWLIPITSAEAVYIESEGWSRFEDILVEKDADLLDLQRESLV